MLQIISRKFFDDSGPVNEQESHGVLYSNCSWIDSIPTSVAQLLPAGEFGQSISAYTLRYTNCYQPNSSSDPMFMPAGQQVVEQFRLLASFWFRALFHFDRQHVELMCRTASRHASEEVVPSKLVPRYFDAPLVGTLVEANGFAEFVKTVVALPRQTYNRVMMCLGGFFDALDALNTNFDLAYSSLVYVLESLSQFASPPQPTWEDFDPQQRMRLDKELAEIDFAKAETIRTILLSNQHLKLCKRFIAFAEDHIGESFFTSEAVDRVPGVRKNELRRALNNLYNARSGYVHELRKVQEHLRFPWPSIDADIFHWSNEPHLTVSGLVRLVRHVLISFVQRQPPLDRESYAWREELPGIIKVEFAPQYWAGQATNFRPPMAKCPASDGTGISGCWG
jgi:hypothetical protein